MFALFPDSFVRGEKVISTGFDFLFFFFLRLLSSASYSFAGESLALLNTTLLRIDDSLSLDCCARLLVLVVFWFVLFCRRHAKRAKHQILSVGDC